MKIRTILYKKMVLKRKRKRQIAEVEIEIGEFLKVNFKKEIHAIYREAQDKCHRKAQDKCQQEPLGGRVPAFFFWCKWAQQQGEGKISKKIVFKRQTAEVEMVELKSKFQERK